MREEQFHEFAVIHRRRRSERRAPSRARFRPIRIGATIEQQTNDRVVAELRGAAQWTPSAGPHRANKARVPVKKFPHTVEIPEGAGDCQIGGRTAIQKQPRGFEVARPGGQRIASPDCEIDGLQLGSEESAQGRVNVSAAIE